MDEVQLEQEIEQRDYFEERWDYIPLSQLKQSRELYRKFDQDTVAQWFSAVLPDGEELAVGIDTMMSWLDLHIMQRDK